MKKGNKNTVDYESHKIFIARHRKRNLKGTLFLYKSR